MTRTLHAAVLSLPLALALAGCGEGRLIVNVDVLSFLSEADRQIPYGPIAGGLSGSAASEPFGVNVPEGVGGASIIDSVIVTAAAEIENQTGSATAEVDLFFGTDSATLYSGSPAITVPAALSPGTTTPIAFTEPVPQEFLGVFNEAVIFVGVRTRYQSLDPIGGPSLEGVARVTEFLARIVASEDVF